MVKEAVMNNVPGGILKLEYEPEVDILTLYLKDTQTSLDYSKDAEDGVILNYDIHDSLVSIEILDASKRYLPQQLAAYNIDEFIDLKTASQISSIAPVTLRTQAENGRLWAIRLGGRWVTTRERLQQYLDGRHKRASISRK